LVVHSIAGSNDPSGVGGRCLIRALVLVLRHGLFVAHPADGNTLHGGFCASHAVVPWQTCIFADCLRISTLTFMLSPMPSFTKLLYCVAFVPDKLRTFHINLNRVSPTLSLTVNIISRLDISQVAKGFLPDTLSALLGFKHESQDCKIHTPTRK
jgi:hypothetical protein